MRLNLARDEAERGTASGRGSAEPSPSDNIVPLRTHKLDELYRAQAPRLLRFFSNRSGSDDPRDLVHETFERLARKGATYLGTVERPEAYLSRIATNLLRDRAKSAMRHSASAHVPADEVPLAGVDPHDLLEARDMLNRLEFAMERLRPRTREIFMACRLDGYSYAEVAERFGMSVRSIRKQMSRAIAEIDSALSEY